MCSKDKTQVAINFFFNFEICTKKYAQKTQNSNKVIGSRFDWFHKIFHTQNCTDINVSAIANQRKKLLEKKWCFVIITNF